MKKLAFSLLSMLGIATYAQNTVTMLHHAGTVTPHYGNSGFVDAYNASVNGDTIYLPGKYFGPPSVINKRLTIIGTGHFPDSTSATGITYIQSSITLGENADSTHIEGLYINGHIAIQNNSAPNKILIRRNYVNGYINFSGDRTTNPVIDARVIENIIGSNVHGENTYHLIVANNIINNIISGVHNGTILNNIIFGDAWAGYPYDNYYAFNDCNNTLIENNILTGTNSNGGTAGLINSTNNTFNNNVFCRNQNFGANTISGNHLSQDYAQLFVSAATKGFSYQYNFQLQNPGNYTGTDATQVGIYGGLLGAAKTASVPMNPHIYHKAISNTTNPNGTLNINVKVKAQTK
jgi:hypothetical protein